MAYAKYIPSPMMRVILVLVLGVLMSPADASLLGRAPTTAGGTDYQAYFDNVLNITWLADANLAASNTFGLGYTANLGMHPDDKATGAAPYINEIRTDGTMSWGAAALHWIDAMNGANYLGGSGWRLPSALSTDGSDPCGPGYNCTGSEYGSLYYLTLGNSWGNGGFTNSGPFSNLQGYYYWFGTELESSNIYAWYFEFDSRGFSNSGYQSNDGKHRVNYAWAVHDGDPFAPVPIPTPLWLLSSALGLLAWRHRRNKSEGIV